MAEDTEHIKPTPTHIFMGGYTKLPGGGQVPNETITGVPARDLFGDDYQHALNAIPRITKDGKGTDIPEPVALALLERLYRLVGEVSQPAALEAPKPRPTKPIPTPTDDGKEAR